MRRTFLLKSMLLLCALVAGSSSVWADALTWSFNELYQNGTKVTAKTVCTSANTTLSFTDENANFSLSVTRKSSNQPGFYTSSGYFRFYSSDVVEIAALNGATISKIVVTATDFSLNSSATGWTTNTKTWEGSASSVSFTGGGTNKWNSIVITYSSGGGGNNVSQPSFNPIGGTYTSAQSVVLTSATDGATIHYTLTEDGTTPEDPTENDATYSSAISVTKSGTIIKAKAFKSEMTASSIVSATYTIKPNKPTISATVSTITISGDEGLNFFYTLDGSTPTKESNKYTSPFSQTSDCTIKARAYDAYDNASDVFALTFKYFPLNPKNINSGFYEKVTNVSELGDGDAILIVYETDKCAMSTTQNTNNRGNASVTISNKNTIDAPSATVQKLVLIKKNEIIENIATDVFYFSTGSGYLYAASSSSNYLRTEDAPDDDNNARATISITNGNATITFTGDNTRNKLMFNDASNQKIFSCYSSGQKAVQIYKEVTRDPSDPEVSGTTVTLTTTDNMDGWRSFYDATKDYEVDTNTTIYVAAVSETAGSVTLTPLAATAIPHGEAVILKTTDAGHSMTLTETTGATTLGANVLTVTDGTNDADGYRLGYKNGIGVAFFKYTATAPSAGIVYIAKANVNTGATAPEFLTIDGETTGVNTLNVERGTLNGEVYNLAGQRVAQPTKGLYIVNGKKVVIK